MKSKEVIQSNWRLLCLLFVGLAISWKVSIRYAKGISEKPNSTSELILAGKRKISFLRVKANSEWQLQADVKKRLRPNHPSSVAELSVDIAKPHDSEIPKIAFLVRTYNPSQENAKIVAQWFKDLSASSVDSFISIDQTDPSHGEQVKFLIEKLLESNLHISNIHRYTVDDMQREYPALIGKEKLGSLAWGYHVQAIDLWMQTLPQKEQTYDHLWTFEDDVGYSGDISQLLREYSNSGADLIGGISHDVATPDWWPTAPSQLFRRRVHEKRMAYQEQCSRMSAKLLGRLHTWSVDGALDWSESMPVTICYMEHMQCRTLQSNDLGEPYTWDPKKAITNKEFWYHLKGANGTVNRPKLYHPLKL